MFFSQTTGDLITHLNYKTAEMTNYKVPTPLGGPLGMIYYKNYLWFAEFIGQKVRTYQHDDACTKLTQPRLVG